MSGSGEWNNRYLEAGVSISKGDELVQRLRKKNEAIGGFAGVHWLNKESGLVACADGVGTKIDLGVRFNAVRPLGQDLVAMCLNDLAVTGAKPLFFLDYFATSRLDVDQADAFIDGVRVAAESCGAVLLGGETAEMPGFYQDGHFDACGFAVGHVTPATWIDGSSITAGDVLVGLSSSGFHSNGYSLIRKLMADQIVDPQAPAPGSSRLWRDVLMEPTRLYVRDAQMATSSVKIKGMAHITGGGLSNIDRILPSGLKKEVDLNSLHTPEYMKWLVGAAGMSQAEAFEVWNMGLGFVFAVAPEDVPRLVQVLPDSFVIGTVQTV
jgi:phosphoribosylformylglycinamidine cyclo-ligase